MKQSNYTVKIIEPSDGYTLTQKDGVELNERIFSKKIFLAINDSADNYKEILDSEADELMKQMEELAKQTEENNDISR